MFKNVVVALKPGVLQGPLLELARKAAPPPGKMHLVTLLQIGTYGDELDRVKEAEASLKEAAKALRADGYDPSYYAGPVVAAAAVDINRITGDRGADLVVIGLAKRTRVSKAVVGSDAQRVLLSSTCPVLSVPMTMG